MTPKTKAKIGQKKDLLVFCTTEPANIHLLPEEGNFTLDMLFNHKSYGTIKLQNATYHKSIFVESLSFTNPFPSELNVFYAVTQSDGLPPDTEFMPLPSSIPINKVLDVSEFVNIWFKVTTAKDAQFDKNAYSTGIKVEYVSTFIDLKDNYVFIFDEATGETNSQDITKTLTAHVNGGVTGFSSADVRVHPIQIPAANLAGVHLSDYAGFTMMFHSAQNGLQRTIANLTLENNHGDTHSARVYIDSDDRIVCEIDYNGDISPIYKSINPISLPTGLHILSFMYQSPDAPWDECPTILLDYAEVDMDIFYGMSLTDPEIEQLKGSYHITEAFFGGDNSNDEHILNGYIYVLILYGDMFPMADIIRTQVELNEYA